MNGAGLRNALNCAVIFPRRDRLLFYALLRAQVRAGVPPARACETLLSLSDLAPPLRRIARAGAQAGHDGRPVVEGIAETRMFPPADMGVLGIAEANGTLAEALEAIEGSAAEALNVTARVVVPNLYYLTVLAVLVCFAWQARDFLNMVTFTDLSGNAAFEFSRWLHDWWIPATGALAGVTGAVWHGKFAWTGRARRLLPVFDAEARYRIGIAFAQLAELLARHGASHGEILAATGSVMGHHRYVAHAVRRARRALDTEGAKWEDALGGGLLSPEHADLLAGLVPGGQRNLYPEAYRTLGMIQRQLLNDRYRLLAGFFRTALLLAILVLLLVLVEGLYSLFGAVA